MTGPSEAVVKVNAHPGLKRLASAWVVFICPRSLLRALARCRRRQSAVV